MSATPPGGRDVIKVEPENAGDEEKNEEVRRVICQVGLQNARRKTRLGRAAKHLPRLSDQEGGFEPGHLLPALQRADRRLPHRVLLRGVLQAAGVQEVRSHAEGRPRNHGQRKVELNAAGCTS